jgi:peptidoglycan/xylan/chitin deacetylase (PgdA/CDA1 family)
MMGRLSSSVRYHRRRLADLAMGVRRRRDDGAVSLTFDDGPQVGTTDLVLDILAHLDVKATFFCVGCNVTANPGLVRRMAAEGHAVGSHSFTHPYSQDLDSLTVHAEYAAGRRAVEAAVGCSSPLFRPPHGHVPPIVAPTLRSLRLQTWLWSIDPEDWRPGARTRQIVADSAKAQAGDVVLLHDWIEQPTAPEALDRSATISALPEIVARIRGKGLHFEGLA